MPPSIKVIDQLNDLRGKKPDCHIIALADLSSRLIFSSSSQEKLPRERLDALCFKADRALNGPASRGIVSVVDTSDEPLAGQIVLVQPEAIHVFLRSTSDPAEALCCVCTSHDGLNDFIHDARRTLAHIDGLSL